MTKNSQSIIEIAGPLPRVQLDLVVPFTTPELTRTALNAANRLGAGLDATIRLLKVQVVPYPFEADQSPIPLEFLQRQLCALPSELPAHREIRLARDYETGLTGALNEDSLIVLATLRRPWRTRTECLAAFLRRTGHRVVMVNHVHTHDQEDNLCPM